MSFVRSRRGLAVLAVVLLILFLFRPGVSELRNRIGTSIGSALGRRVAIDDVHIHILPRPGFDLEGLVIYDDPAFSAEPMIRAQEVCGAIRLRSLLRGRLEIATLSATEPSINIVRNNEGRWNLASLIERNAQIPAAPTQKVASERRPAFPYLEATTARINFKIGQEKKSYALTDADVALWQDSENSWGARIKAQPVRTDFNLTDTGLLQINASWQRASNLRLTPMRLSVTWEKGQLGQITTLLTGRDRGWRGGVTLTGNVAGTPEALAVDSRAVIEGFRRYDILYNRNVNLAAACTGKYDAMSRLLSGLVCEAPIGGGTLRLQGSIGAVTATAESDRRSNFVNHAPKYSRSNGVPYNLTLAAERVPLASVVVLLHETKQQLPADLTAEGLLDAEFHASRNGTGSAEFSGTGKATELSLASNGGKDRIALGDIPLALAGGREFGEIAAESERNNASPKESEPTEAHLRVGPSSLKVNASPALSTGGWISLAGYRFFLRGDTELSNLFRLETALGLPAARPAAEGDVKLDVSTSGLWQGFASANALGTAQLRNVRAEMRGLSAPIQIASATVLLAPDVFSVEKLLAQTGSTHWTGSVTAPRHCAPACQFQFDLAADQLATEDLGEWFAPQTERRPWYHILSASDQLGPSPLLMLQAHGSLRIARLMLTKALATKVSTQLTLDRGRIALTGASGELLHGSHHGNWAIDASAQPLHYRGSGMLQNISLTQVGALMNDAWVAGNADGTFDLETAGADFHDFLANSDGRFQFVMRNGSFTHIEIPGAPKPLPVHRFAGDLRLKKGIWELSGGELESRDGIYRVSGTVSAADGAAIVLRRSDEQSWNVTGTLAKPHVSATSHPEISGAETSAKIAIKP